MMREVEGRDLRVGMILALPMGRTATVTQVKLGLRFSNFRTEEYGWTRVELGYPVMIEEEESE